MNTPNMQTPRQPSLSVIVPCYNEALTIQEVLAEIRRVPISDIEIIVVDDASTDDTRHILETKCSGLYDHLIKHEKNSGKGAALRSGFAVATKDLVVVQDADLEYNPQEIPRLMQPISDGKADVVYGSRFVGGEAHRVLFYWHSLGNRLLTTLSNMTTNLNLTDMETCYKLFKRSVIQDLVLKENRFGFEPEVTAKIARKGLRVYEVGISYSGRTYAEGKKIGWRDGVVAIYCIAKYGFVRKAPVKPKATS